MKNNLKLAINVLIGMCVVCLIGLTIYTVIYSNGAEQRQQNQINNLESSSSSESKTEQDILDDKISEADAFKPPILVPEISPPTVGSSSAEEIVQNIAPENMIESARNDIKRFILVGDFELAGNLANKVVSEYFVEDGDVFAEFYSYQDFAYWDYIELFDKYSKLGEFKDPSIYLMALYTLPPEYQVEQMPSPTTVYIPVSSDNPLTIVSTEVNPSGNTRVNEFFSTATADDVYCVTVDVAETVYNIYLVNKKGYPIKITNIEVENKDQNVFTTYKEYFEMYGKRETDIYKPIS